MQNKKTLIKNGSVLVFTLLLLASILMIALAVSSSGITDRKSSMATEKTAKAMQLANNGSEAVMQKIRPRTSEDKLSSVFLGDCSSGIVTGNGYAVSFKKSDDSTSNDCEDKLGDIIEIKSVGTSGDASRAISVSVTPPDPGRDLEQHWKLDNNGDNEAGTVVGNPVGTSPIDGIDNNDADEDALFFNGTSDYINLGNSADLNMQAVGQGKMSFSLWVNPSAFPSNAGNCATNSGPGPNGAGEWCITEPI